MSVVGTGVPNALYSQLIISLQLPLSTHHLIASLVFLHLPSPFILRVFSLSFHSFPPPPSFSDTSAGEVARGESWSQAGSQATDHLPSSAASVFQGDPTSFGTNSSKYPPKNQPPLGREQTRHPPSFFFFFFFCLIIACDLGNKHPSPLLLHFALRFAALTSPARDQSTVDCRCQPLALAF